MRHHRAGGRRGAERQKDLPVRRPDAVGRGGGERQSDLAEADDVNLIARRSVAACTSTPPKKRKTKTFQTSPSMAMSSYHDRMVLLVAIVNIYGQNGILIVDLRIADQLMIDS